MDKHIPRLDTKDPVARVRMVSFMLFRPRCLKFYALCDRLADLHAGQSAGAFS